MKLFSKQQIARAVRAKDLYEKMIFPSTADFREIVRASIPGCDVTRGSSTRFVKFSNGSNTISK
jgi:hypothetical protein